MIYVVTKDYCPYCNMTKSFLKSINKEYTEIDVTNDGEKLQEIVSVSRMMTVPQIFDGEIETKNLIGGYDDMMRKFENGEIFTDVSRD